ncbi:unnamed protein product [Ostreobium quekettii]|uniref:Protein kinase domain-containing protein n=1 Tax=Ostreobium quekettii TaxID=121088 RepID=A0A8S1J368_9CHLO|nr:unnamed protein product [Ostreobium quekettii]
MRSQLKRKGSRTLAPLKELCVDDSMFVPPEQLMPGKKIGAGAFATVELCGYTDRAGKSRPVAVKRLKPELLEQEGELNKFVEEAKLLRTIRHEYITEFIGLGGDRRGTGMYIVQEYMNGGTIKSLVMRQMGEPFKRLYSFEGAFEWLIQIAEGLAHLHELGVVHRDLKLENVLLTVSDPSEGKVAKLADFGLSVLTKQPGGATTRHAADAEGGTPPKLATFSKMPTFSTKKQPALKRVSSKVLAKDTVDAKYELTGRTGSLMYMAPEVFRCEKYNEKVDVFSFAIIMYELLRKSVLLVFVATTGSPEDVERHAENIVNGMRPPMPQEWPDELADLIRECWHQNPDKRPAMKDVIPRLRRLKDAGVLQEPARNASAGCCSVQ